MDNPSGQLIVDVGMHDGSDTEFYLAKGFNVLAIEANPELVRRAEERFEAEIARGRLEVLWQALADHDGEIKVHIGEEDLWGSTDASMAGRGIHEKQSAVVVPCTTLDAVLKGRGRAHYVKIDIEGRDPDCIYALGNVDAMPLYLSFEADLTDAEEVHRLLDRLESYGYKDFKLVNQATHASRKLPNPPLEGLYVDASFGKHHSGPFGEESPGPWVDRDQVEGAYLAVLSQQAARISYSATGRLMGLPLARLHGPLEWIYNLDAVTRVRHQWSRWRGIEPGGWFDIHARLGDASRPDSATEPAGESVPD